MPSKHTRILIPVKMVGDNSIRKPALLLVCPCSDYSLSYRLLGSSHLPHRRSICPLFGRRLPELIQQRVKLAYLCLIKNLERGIPSAKHSGTIRTLVFFSFLLISIPIEQETLSAPCVILIATRNPFPLSFSRMLGRGVRLLFISLALHFIHLYRYSMSINL